MIDQARRPAGAPGPEDLLRRQARALGDPSRHEIFRYVAARPDGVGVAELSSHLGLNHNAVRAHLAKLTDAGLLVEGRAPRTRPGRPALEYRVAPDADSRWGVTGPYERLSLLLAEMVRTGDDPETVGRRAGAAGARPGDGAEPVQVLLDEMTRSGFAPTLRGGDAEREVVLHACPFAHAAAVDRETICTLHLGIARGTADRTDGGIAVDGLVVGDPTRADPGCRFLILVRDTAEPER